MLHFRRCSVVCNCPRGVGGGISPRHEQVEPQAEHGSRPGRRNHRQASTEFKISLKQSIPPRNNCFATKL